MYAASVDDARVFNHPGCYPLTNNAPFKDQYVAQRARGAYVATMCQPEASFDLSFAAQVTNPQDEDAKALNKRLQWQI